MLLSTAAQMNCSNHHAKLHRKYSMNLRAIAADWPIQMQVVTHPGHGRFIEEEVLVSSAFVKPQNLNTELYQNLSCFRM